MSCLALRGGIFETGTTEFANPSWLAHDQPKAPPAATCRKDRRDTFDAGPLTSVGKRVISAVLMKFQVFSSTDGRSPPLRKVRATSIGIDHCDCTTARANAPYFQPVQIRECSEWSGEYRSAQIPAYSPYPERTSSIGVSNRSSTRIFNIANSG